MLFPCNQFGRQEPGTHEEIKSFAGSFGADLDDDTFVLFAKGDVNGANARPVFRHLKALLPDTFGATIKWNFTKFLVSKNGEVIKRYAPNITPEKIEADIKEALDA